MKQAITGHQKDELLDWFAELNYAHFQHLRNKPPRLNRTWV